MKRTPLFIAAAALALAACNNQSEPEVIDTNPDPMATALANAAPVELPPAIKADKTFRCKDNSLAFVTFFQGDEQAVVRFERGGTPTTLRAENAGDPLTAEDGWSLEGGESAITLASPGKPAQTCRS